MEEVLRDLQLLFPTEDRSPLLHLFLLLCHSSYKCLPSRSKYTELVNYICSFCHHPLECHCHSKVSTIHPITTSFIHSIYYLTYIFTIIGRSFYLVIFWVLFENVMAMHRTKGTLIGLFEGGRVNEWVVTEKLGDTLNTKLLPQNGRLPKR